MGLESTIHPRSLTIFPMIELTRAIPDADVLLALEPEELAAKLLFLLRKRSFPDRKSVV